MKKPLTRDAEERALDYVLELVTLQPLDAEVPALEDVLVVLEDVGQIVLEGVFLLVAEDAKRNVRLDALDVKITVG